MLERILNQITHQNGESIRIKEGIHFTFRQGQNNASRRLVLKITDNHREYGH